jgi:hypothetical protein
VLESSGVGLKDRMGLPLPRDMIIEQTRRCQYLLLLLLSDLWQ